MYGWLIFLITLILLVLVHEFGHFIAAKFFKLKILEVGFGFPPKIKSFKKKDTEYSINLLPLGGFVRLFGEGGEHPEDKRSFAHQLWWKKLIIVIAGVVFNFILGALLLSVGFNFGMPRMISDYSHIHGVSTKNQVTIVDVEKKSPASTIDLGRGDAILEVNSIKITDTKNFQDVLGNFSGQKISITIKRGNKESQESVKLRSGKKALLGVTIIDQQTYKTGFFKSFLLGFRETGVIIGFIAKGIFGLLWELVTSGTTGGDGAGPIGIFFLATSVGKLGFVYILQFIALISVNIGLVNLFPFPALDGGRIIFALLEGVRGKKLNPALENSINMVGFLILIAFIVLIFVRDIIRIPYYKDLFQSK